MSDSDRGNPIQAAVIVLMLVGGGWYFFRHYEIDGLDGVSVYAKQLSDEDPSFVGYRHPLSIAPAETLTATRVVAAADSRNPFSLDRRNTAEALRAADRRDAARTAARRFRKLRIASWALDGFGPTKLANEVSRRNVVRIIRQFDIVALQQIASLERDLVPRLVDAINEGDRRYDYVIGSPTGPPDRPEQLVFVFDINRVQIDRNQTYTLADPDNQLTFDPLVAWFRAAQPAVDTAWTFSLVNLRVDLARAPSEVALLSHIFSAIANDGRGEDDVILAGLFQADDAYLIPTVAGKSMTAAVNSVPTDIFGKHQTSNLLLNTDPTNEYLGRGGAFDFLRVYNMSLAEAEVVTSHLPVFAEFTPIEGGQL